MPRKSSYDKLERDPSWGYTLEDILARYDTLNIKSPYKCIKVPTAWLVDPKLTHRQKITLLVMHAYASRDKIITITVRQLQIYLHGDKVGTKRAIHGLEELGYIQRIDSKNGMWPQWKLLDPTPKVRKQSGQRKNKKSDPNLKEKS